MLKTIYGFGIEGTKLCSENQISPHRSSSGLRVIFSDVPKTTFYRKLNKLEKEGYIIIKKEKRLSKNYEIINRQKIIIPSKRLKSREVQLTEKGKEVVFESLIVGFPKKIDVLMNGRVEEILFIDIVEYLKTNFGIEIRKALFHLLNQLEENISPIDIDRIEQKISKKK